MLRLSFITSCALLSCTSLVAGCGGAGMGDAVRVDVTSRMQSVQAPIAACYARALSQNRKLRGTMVLSFTAAPETGKFEKPRIQRSEVPDPDLEQCVLEQVSGLRLAKPQSTGVAVTYPLRFAPSDAP